MVRLSTSGCLTFRVATLVGLCLLAVEGRGLHAQEPLDSSSNAGAEYAEDYQIYEGHPVEPQWRFDPQFIDASAATVGWHHNAGATLECKACHAAEAEDSDAFRVTLEAANLLLYERELNRSVASLDLGASLVRVLNDDILRSHLQLQDKPALVVDSTLQPEAVLQRGDVILSIDGKPASDPIRLRASLIKQDASKEDSEMHVAVIRAGKEESLKVPLSQLTPSKEPFRIGVQLEAPSEAMRSQLGLYENEGVIVTEVVEDSPAEAAGLQKHDILLRAEQQRISAREDLRTVIQASRGQAMKLVLMRTGKEIELLVTPERQTKNVAAVCPAVPHGQNLVYGQPLHVWDSPTPGAVTRYGYYFDPAQDKSLETESESGATKGSSESQESTAEKSSKGSEEGSPSK